MAAEKEPLTAAAVQRLVERKDAVEAQIRAYYEVLETQKDAGMEQPLVDVEGYPRTDIDIYQVRTARHNIICLQNDHKELMTRIEEALHGLHARERQKRLLDATDSQMEAVMPDASPPLRAFAKVDMVAPGSPASVAGLLPGDEIVEFGTVNTQNFQNLQNIASVVQHSETRPLSITVLRTGKKLHLGLTPHRWSGRGLLGCNIIPL
ncbi:26S proteasome non-ATPase regulatory subunit 9 [Callorhinchus milii]|uniref:26S proteasome non-ATPase regulatory subunit 9 n=1 Tax=Callorhinchus milii TaxID=7868 RepID=V9KN86_CALMI|nr:26S proteasome non-ATPase regulatory subunit 9 [Callorhinchus milii]|eukprot:gi/632968239/ref/XP_007900417.1/ PREDICTED: 26S proteasome non-ATPase regulatory subunit 9 [Callorhinchus milii]